MNKLNQSPLDIESFADTGNGGQNDCLLTAEPRTLSVVFRSVPLCASTNSLIIVSATQCPIHVTLNKPLMTCTSHKSFKNGKKSKF